MFQSRVLRSSALAGLALGAALVVVTACNQVGKITPGGSPLLIEPTVSMVRVPPAVEKATLQPLAQEVNGANALLEVQFERGDKRLEKGFRIVLDGREVVLRDDGTGGDVRANDGKFSALIRADFARISRQAGELAALQEEPQLVFRGRQVVGVEDPVLVRERQARLRLLADHKQLIEKRLAINLFDLGSIVRPSSIDPARSLVITHPSVVQDPTRTIDPCTGAGNPDGVWTFKHAVTEMVAGTGVDPADFVERWLRLWESNQVVSSGFISSARGAIRPRVLDVWPRTAAGKLDLNQSPFRLAAIVNRIDLAENLVYGAGSAGEGRLVFGVWDRGRQCTMLPFSVIFEYGIEKRNCVELRDWAQQWVALNTHPINSPAYRAALEAITQQFVKAGAAPTKPNGSALNQIRTNENALDPLWELREFVIDRASHLLIQVTTKQTPAESLNNTAVLANYINGNEADILAGTDVVPDHFPGPGASFMAASSLATAANQLQTHFRAPGIANNEARFNFSLNTCSACHIRETGTNGGPPGNTAFLHIDPTTMPARLSRFMTGSTPILNDSPDLFTVPDPVSAVARQFNDLDRRRQKLAAIAGTDCIRVLIVPPRLERIRLPIPLPDRELPRIDPRINPLHEPLRMVH